MMRVEVIISQDSRAFAKGNVSKLPSGDPKIAKRKANAELAKSYNRRRYAATRVWRCS